MKIRRKRTPSLPIHKSIVQRSARVRFRTILDGSCFSQGFAVFHCSHVESLRVGLSFCHCRTAQLEGPPGGTEGVGCWACPGHASRPRTSVLFCTASFHNSSAKIALLHARIRSIAIKDSLFTVANGRNEEEAPDKATTDDEEYHTDREKHVNSLCSRYKRGNQGRIDSSEMKKPPKKTRFPAHLGCSKQPSMIFQATQIRCSLLDGTVHATSPHRFLWAPAYVAPQSQQWRTRTSSNTQTKGEREADSWQRARPGELATLCEAAVLPMGRYRLCNKDSPSWDSQAVVDTERSPLQ